MAESSYYSRQSALWSLVLTAGLLAWGAEKAAASEAKVPPSGTFAGSIAVEVADLKQQLESGLKARRPVEFEFIARVVGMVESNELPLSLVNSVFLWARKKKPYAFPYFERALRMRAAELGISI